MGSASRLSTTNAGHTDSAAVPAPHRRPPAWVPIRPLAERHRGRILRHLLSLDEGDRYLRFGYQASDHQIERYVERIDFMRDEVFGIFNRRLELIALAHLAMPDSPSDRAEGGAAEFGVSVVRKARGRGFGARLFEHAMLHARNRGVQTLTIHALSENAAMLKIARDAEEKRGGLLMNWWNGDGAARVYADDGEGALLLERACGPRSLVQMARNGHDEEATGILCDAIARLHALG